jgi:hypothetical protein
MVIKHIVVWEFIISNIKEELPTCWSLSQWSHDDTKFRHGDCAIFVFVKEHECFFEFYNTYVPHITQVSSLLRILYVMCDILKKLWKYCFKMYPIKYTYLWSMKQQNMNINKSTWLNYKYYSVNFIVWCMQLLFDGFVSAVKPGSFYICALDTLHLFWHKSNMQTKVKRMPSCVSSLMKHFPEIAVAQDIDYSYYRCSCF